MARRPLALAVLVLAVIPLFTWGESKTVPLPPPAKEGKVSVEAALAARRSVRAYAKQPLTLAELSQLLWASQGVTGPGGKRSAPSARARYPLELAVAAQNVEGLAAGMYRYLPVKHALELLFEGKAGEPILGKAASQSQIRGAPAVFVFAAVYERMGSGPQARTFTDYEAGLASENLLLQAVALGLGGVVTGGVDAAALKEAAQLGQKEQVIVAVPVGHPAG